MVIQSPQHAKEYLSLIQPGSIFTLPGIVTFVLALYLTLAYASDVAKITGYTTRSISFMVIGGLVVILNFVMSIGLFRNEGLRNQPTKSTQQAV